MHQRVRVVGATDPLALLEQDLVDVRSGLALGAAEQHGVLDEPAAARNDVLVEVHPALRREPRPTYGDADSAALSLAV